MSSPVADQALPQRPEAQNSGGYIPTCIFCSSTGPFSLREYGARSLPEGVTWPSSHCFQGKSLAICENCGGGFVRESIRDEDISAFYSSIYDARHVEHASRPQELNELNARFLSQSLYLKSFVDLRDGMRILELGPNVVSALPALSLFCRPQYYYFEQVDSEIISSYGGRRLGSYASGAEIVRRVGRGALDLVYGSHSLEHVNPASLNELIEGTAAAIAPGGHLFFEVPDDLSIDMLLVPHTVFFTEASILHLLDRHGLEIINLARWGKSGGQEKSSKVLFDPEKSRARASARSPSDLRSIIRSVVLGIPFIEKAVRPWRLQRGLMRALRRLPTPYEPTPYFRVIARKL